MIHPELEKHVQAYADSRQGQVDAIKEMEAAGKEKGLAKARYARARLFAWVVVSYTKEVGQTLEPTKLLVVPPIPKGVPIPEGMEWPEGAVMGPLAGVDERKHAAEALTADLLAARENAQIAAVAAEKIYDVERGTGIASLSYLKAASQELAADGTQQRMGAERSYGRPVGQGTGPRNGSGRGSSGARLRPREYEPMPDPPPDLTDPDDF